MIVNAIVTSQSLVKKSLSDILRPMENKYFSLLGKVVLVLIVLGIVGYSTYYLCKISNQNQTAKNVGLKTTTTVKMEINVTETPTQDPTSQIIFDIKQGLISKYGQDASSLKITVSKIEGNYASGAASEQGDGGVWFAAKTNNVWKIVWDGNGVIQCSSLTSYPDFPTTMIPECYNDQNQTMVKR